MMWQTASRSGVTAHRVARASWGGLAIAFLAIGLAVGFYAAFLLLSYLFGGPPHLRFVPENERPDIRDFWSWDE